MLNYIEDMAAKNNYSSIRLDAYSGNETALKLYESFGYKKAGQVYFPWETFLSITMRKVFFLLKRSL